MKNNNYFLFICVLLQVFFISSVFANNITPERNKNYLKNAYNHNLFIFNDKINDTYHNSDIMYQKLKGDFGFSDSNFNGFDGEYVLCLKNKLSQNFDIVTELYGRYDILRIELSRKDKNVNIDNIGIKSYVSFNINESSQIKNSINTGILAQNNHLAKERNNLHYRGMHTAFFTQYDNIYSDGILKSETIISLAFNNNTIEHVHSNHTNVFNRKNRDRYFNLMAKTKVGIESKIGDLDTDLSLVGLINTKLNNRGNLLDSKYYRNINFKTKDVIYLGLENEYRFGMLDATLRAGYDISNRTFGYGINFGIEY